MLYTRKGDAGTTKDFKSGPGQRKSKSSCQTEALGALDELNSFLGLAKVKSVEANWKVDGKSPVQIVHWVQNCLFSVQAETAGADKKVGQEKVAETESLIDAMENVAAAHQDFFHLRWHRIGGASRHMPHIGPQSRTSRRSRCRQGRYRPRQCNARIFKSPFVAHVRSG